MKFPALVVPKLRGFRMAVINGKPLAKEGFVIENRMVLDMLGGLPAFDGHFVMGDPREDCHDRALEFLSTPDAMEPWTFWVYDLYTRNPYTLAARLETVSNMIVAIGKHVQYAEHYVAVDKDELKRRTHAIKEMGHYGVVIRDPFDMTNAGPEI